MFVGCPPMLTPFPFPFSHPRARQSRRVPEAARVCVLPTHHCGTSHGGAKISAARGAPCRRRGSDVWPRRWIPAGGEFILAGRGAPVPAHVVPLGSTLGLMAPGGPLAASAHACTCVFLFMDFPAPLVDIHYINIYFFIKDLKIRKNEKNNQKALYPGMERREPRQFVP
uniref:Uncharacterized protein n=1 Tax=Xenopus tropicalis TaxID=8364 RepID=A0A1B8XTN3_XENTR